jgi:hypothetical protein
MIVSPQLSMQAEIPELQSQKEFLKREQQCLESEVKEAEARSREQSQADPAAATTTTTTTIQSVFQKYLDHSFAPPRQFSSLTRQSSTPSSSKASTSTLNPFGPDSRSAGSSSSRASGHLGKPPTPSDRDDSILEAMRLQNKFYKDHALSVQRAELAKSTQRLFECGICMEEMPDDSIARPDPCGHTFFYRTRHHAPQCPTCTAGKGKGKEAAGGT